jgi:hypothetical protein
MAAVKGTGRLATGRFRDRSELVRNVWAIHRQQVYPNLKAIAAICGATTDVVKTIIAAREGLDDYMEQGCLTGR